MLLRGTNVGIEFELYSIVKNSIGIEFELHSIVKNSIVHTAH